MSYFFISKWVIFFISIWVIFSFQYGLFFSGKKGSIYFVLICFSTVHFIFIFFSPVRDEGMAVRPGVFSRFTLLSCKITALGESDTEGERT